MVASLFNAHTLLFAAIGCAAAITPGFPYDSQKIRGVNLGGWLVLEPWVTPELFDKTGNDAIIDEYTFGELQDHDTALAALTEHWDSWITEDDFKQIAAAGLNHVRLPIGYWAWDVSAGEPYVQGQLPYLYKAIEWARNNQLHVVLDLHGAPGSQNGFDNSGQKLTDGPTWQTKQENVDRSSAIIKRVSAEFADQTGTVTVIAALNEPAGFFSQQVIDVAKQYWLDSYESVRHPYGNGNNKEGNAVLFIHDVFQPLDFWKGFMPSPKYEGVFLDTHIYQIFDVNAVAQTPEQHIASACATNGSLADFTKNEFGVVVGEWSPASDDCAKYLNGRGVGARYDGTYPDSTFVGNCDGRTGDASKFTAEYKDFLGKYWEAQAMSYEKGSGWIQWTWKTAAEEWSYKSGLEHGWIPQNPTEYKNPKICG